MNPDLIILGKDPDAFDERDTYSRWLLRCQACDQIRSVSYQTMYKARRQKRNQCPWCSKRHNLIENIPDRLIILEQFVIHGTHAKALIQCPDCGLVRLAQRSNIRKQGNTLCCPCAHRRRLIPIEDTDNIIILEQLIEYDASGNPRALAQCPICGTIRPVTRSNIVNRGHTKCPSCAQVSFIEDTDDIIILEQLLAHDHTRALAQCPDCGIVRPVLRGNIVTSNSTRCLRCSQIGERSHFWRGGGSTPYPIGWPRIAAAIRERDFHTCQCPDCRATSDSEGQLLDVHHIIPLRYSHDNSEYNLITLCHPCHMWAEANPDQSVSIFDAIIDAIYSN